MHPLRPNSLLQGGRYKIQRTLGQGGFGITYLAIQSGLERKVAIKEFFMKELCERDVNSSHVTLGTEGSRETVSRFREKFLKEARNIAKLNHPKIVRIIDVFEENGTAYYVMEYAENGSLADKVKRDGYLCEPIATHYILQIAEALNYIHKRKMNHLDVKPANIMLNEEDNAVLIDFGLSKQYDATTGNQTSNTPVGISEGYAPMEQYMQGGVGEFSPETDIYALGATFYKLLTGVTPPNASWVNNEGVPVNELKSKGVSDKAISVISNAMEGRKKDRMKSVRNFIIGLKDSTITSASTPYIIDDEATILTHDLQKKEERLRNETEVKIDLEPRVKEVEEKRKKAIQKSSSKMWLWILISVVFIALICFFSIKNLNTPGNDEAMMEIGNHDGSTGADNISEAMDSDVIIKEQIEDTSRAQSEINYKLAGKMGGFPIKLDLTDNNGDLTAVYYNVRFNTKLKMCGYIKSDGLYYLKDDATFELYLRKTIDNSFNGKGVDKYELPVELAHQ